MPTALTVGQKVDVSVQYDGTISGTPTTAVTDTTGAALAGVISVSAPTPSGTNAYAFTCTAVGTGIGQVRFYANGSNGQIASFFSFSTSPPPPTATTATVTVGTPY